MISTDTVIVYHADCIDGYTAAWVATFEYSNAVLFPAYYGAWDKILAEIRKHHSAVIVDFSLPIEKLAELEKDPGSSKHIMIIDHHKSAAEKYFPYAKLGTIDNFWALVHTATIFIDQNESGATLANKLLNYAEYPKTNSFLDTVKDYDLWTFKLPHTKEIHMYLRTQEKSLDNWTRIALAFLEEDDEYRSIIAQGTAILAYHNSIVERLVTGNWPVVIKGIKGLAVNCSAAFSSDVGNALAKLSGTYGLTFQLKKQDELICSLRSIGDSCDVAKLAESLGGGGHKNAAGFSLSLKELLQWHNTNTSHKLELI